MIRVFTSKTQLRGKEGEEIAAAFLVKQGFSIVGRNISGAFGEIDIVAKKGATVYFFEVKSGSEGSFINPAENFTRAKLRKFFLSARYYALANGIRNYVVQGIVVLFPAYESDHPHIEIFELL